VSLRIFAATAMRMVPFGYAKWEERIIIGGVVTGMVSEAAEWLF
jgi:hypothetical protein